MTTEPDPRPFDALGFFRDLDSVRRMRDVTWKRVAAEAQISASTLTRMGQGRRPDIDSYASLVAWSGLRGEDYIRDAARDDAATLAEIGVLLRHDPNLSAEAATAIQALVETSYERLRGRA